MRTMTILATAACAFVGLVVSASAQQSGGASPSTPGHSMAPGTQTLPEQCRKAAADMPRSAGMDMANMSTQGMTEAQRANMDAMARMRPPMMAGIHAKDPDVAFMCGMIPHHQGAIDIARVVLRHGDDPEAKRMAERVIQDQGKEIAEMTAWPEKNAK